MSLLQELHAHTVIVGLSGIAFACIGSRVVVKRLVSVVTDSIPTSRPDHVRQEDWDRAVKLDGDPERPTALLGAMEASLFFLALWLQAEIVAAGWLAFKVASKWEAWQSILKVPEKLGLGESTLGYLAARNQWGSLRLQKWLIGTLGNILVGFGAVAAAKGVGLVLLRIGV